MKKTIKVMAAVLLVMAMVFSIASCGALDMNKVKGDWILDTINGKTVADAAAESGSVEVFGMRVYNITDKTITISYVGPDGNIATTTSDITVKSNGFEFTLDGVLMGMIYDDKAGTLSYNLHSDTFRTDYVLKKGTYDLAGKYAEYVAAAQAAQAVVEEGGEEYSEEDYGEYEE